MKSCSKCLLQKDVIYKKSGLCRACYSAQWNSLHLDRAKATRAKSGAAWEKRNKDRMNAYRKQWRQEHPDIMTVSRRKSYNADPQTHRNRTRSFVLANPTYGPEWRKSNPSKVIESTHRRRARFRGAFIAPVDRDDIYERDMGICGICKRRVSKAQFTIDHKKPLAKGGPHEPSNVQVAHRSCNSRKGARWDELDLLAEVIQN